MQAERPSRALPLRLQAYALAGFVALVGLVILFTFVIGIGPGLSQGVPSAAPLAKFVPSGRQLASLQIDTVTTRVFHSEIVTDGYVAPNGGLATPGLSSEGRIAHGLPFLTNQSTDVLQAESDLATAKAQFRAAQLNERRQLELYNSDGAALKDWQQSQLDLATSSAALASARNRLRVMGKSDREIAAFEGKTGGTPAFNAVFSVGDLSTVWLIANVREADASLVHLGDRVDVRLPAFPGQMFQSTINYIASVIDPVTHRLIVGAKIHNTGDRFKPNMQAAFTIFAGGTAEAPGVPKNAVIYDGDTAQIWVADSNGGLSVRDITVGLTNGNYIEVTKGLSPGERIVTKGALFLDQAATSG